jgi:hypothetical protein
MDGKNCNIKGFFLRVVSLYTGLKIESCRLPNYLRLEVSSQHTKERQTDRSKAVGEPLDRKIPVIN